MAPNDDGLLWLKACVVFAIWNLTHCLTFSKIWQARTICAWELE
jgi:hypothetical protein